MPSAVRMHIKDPKPLDQGSIHPHRQNPHAIQPNMTQPLTSVTHQLTQRLVSPFGLAIVTGVASSSFRFFGSLELALDGVFPATGTEAERAKKGVSDAAALRLWEWVFYRAKVSPSSVAEAPFCAPRNPTSRTDCLSQKRFAAAAMLSSASYLVASAFRPDLRPLLFGASLLSFSLAPYTFIVSEYQYHIPQGRGQNTKLNVDKLQTVMPINRDILQATDEVSKLEGKGVEPGFVDKLFCEWRKYDAIRVSIAGVAWSLGTAALLLAWD